MSSNPHMKIQLRIHSVCHSYQVSLICAIMRFSTAETIETERNLSLQKKVSLTMWKIILKSNLLVINKFTLRSYTSTSSAVTLETITHKSFYQNLKLYGILKF